MFIETDLFTANHDVWFLYWNSFYYAVLMLNGNEVGPRTVGHLAFVSTILLCGAIINANIFGNLAVIIQELGKKAMRF